MNREVEIVQSAYAAFAMGDLPTVLAALDPNVEWREAEGFPYADGNPNIGPDADGEFAPEAYDRLRSLGDWMNINGEAIYNTRPVAPYKEGKICFTTLRDGTVYAIYLAEEDETSPPSRIVVYSHRPPDGGEIHLLGIPEPLRWEKTGKGALIYLPAAAVSRPPCRYAWTLKISGPRDLT